MNVVSYLFLLSVIVYTGNIDCAATEYPSVCQWAICDGKKCPIGKQIRSKAMCCSPDEGYQGHSIQEWCKQICHLTGEDFQEIRDILKETSEIYLKVNVL